MTSAAEQKLSLQNICLKPSEHVFVLKILTNDLIFEIIFDACTPATSFKLARTCRIAYAAVRFYVGRAFNINRHLSLYFPDPLAFRSLQARTAALVSGSNALQFFDRSTYDNSDLDVYVSMDWGVEVGRWMLDQGYTYKPNSEQSGDIEREVKYGTHFDMDYDESKGISTVLMFVKPSESDTEKELQVHVIVALCTPMEVILHFHSTVVLNVIAWDTAYSLYPTATFENRLSLFLRGEYIHDERNESAIAKYKERGWTMLYGLLPSSILDLSPDFTDDDDDDPPRWIGDGHSWTIRLPTEGVVLPSKANEKTAALTRDPCIATSWQMSLEETPQICCEAVEFFQCRYAYMTASSRQCIFYQIWMSRARERTLGVPKEQRSFIDEEVIQYCVNSLERRGAWRHW